MEGAGLQDGEATYHWSKVSRNIHRIRDVSGVKPYDDLSATYQTLP